jgi:hypothetical protein
LILSTIVGGGLLLALIYTFFSVVMK